MKHLIFIFTFIFSVALSQKTIAQDRDKDSHSDRWERYRSEKIAFLTEKLELTPSEAQKFWPVYNELEQKKWEAQKARREIERKIKDAEETMSEKEIIKLTRDFAEGMEAESKLLVSYNEKLLDVLPPHKVLLLYKAENEFRMHMIKKFRDKKRNGN